MNQTTKKVVVVGGGFAGINLIKRLANDEHYQITLVDTHNYHFFPPLLYQVATAFIEPSNISYPFRRMFQQKKNLRGTGSYSAGSGSGGQSEKIAA